MKNIDKNIIYLGWVSFFTDMASNMVTTLLPIFIIYVLHEGVDKLGIIIAIATFISYIFRIVFGYLSDRFQIVKPFVVAGYFISAIAKPLMAFSGTYLAVATLRGAERMGKAIRSASKDSLISSYAKEKADGKTFGFHKMMDISGELFGALIIFVIFMFFAKSEVAIRDIFAFTLIPGLMATMIAYVLVKDTPYKHKSKNIVVNKEDLKLLPILFIYFGFVFFVMSEQFFILKAKELGYELSTISLFIMVFTFTQAVVSYYGGIFSDKFGIYKSLVASFMFAILSIMTLEINLWISFIFLGLFTVISLNAIRADISKNAISKGFIYGIFYAGVAIFSSLGALIVGFIWKIYGFDTVVIFSEAGMIIMLILLMLSIKKI
ncbi:MAG: MFS transporter [Sulfurospirillaceae bacterium]|nr:MFS transporter [Sulfurospirillaceae bacterium]